MSFSLDPFARVSFVNQSQKTDKVMKTVCPTWDQTLIFESVSIYGNKNDVSANPPQVIIEVFDYDTLVRILIKIRAKQSICMRFNCL